MKSPVLLLQALLKDLEAHDNDMKGLNRDFLTIDRRFKNEGIGFLTVTLPSLGSAILVALQTGGFACPTSFRKKGALPVFLRGLLSKIFDPTTGQLLDASSDYVEFALQICNCFKKLNLESKRQAKLESSAFDEFIRWDNSLKSVSDIDSRRFRIFLSVCDVLLRELSNFDSFSFKGRHGPGSVYEGLKPNEKWLYTYLSSLSDDRFDDFGYDFLYGHHRPESSIIELRSNCSRLVSVPKNSTSVRLITVEPFMNQFIQGGLKDVLWKLISTTPLRHFLELDRQDVNQKLALDGSLTGEFCTIDLKSASDSLSNSLVHSIFCRYEHFFKTLMSSRTPYVNVDGNLHLLRKYAGMGNATTFPIQSIVYACICIACILDSEGKNPSDRNIIAIAPRLQVYGDDIIIHKKYAMSLTSWLTDFGFTVNLSKSFLKGNFRESCGVDAYKGDTITPCYIRHYPFCDNSLSPKELTNCVENSNRFFFRALYHSANFLKELVEAYEKELPLVPKNSGFLGWHTRQDVRTFSRWCENLHRFKHRMLIITSKQRSDHLDGYAALLKFFHHDSHREVSLRKDHLSRTDQRYKTSISREWCYI